MKRIMVYLRPTPLTLLLLTAILGIQVALESSVSTTFLKAGSGVMSITHVWGGVLTADTIRGETVYVVAWWELMARLLGSYALAASIIVPIHDPSVRRLVTLLGLGTLFVIASTFFSAITMSKHYWGYYFHRPQVLSEIYEVSSVTSISVLTQNGIPYSGWDKGDPLEKRVARCNEDPHYCLDERLLVSLGSRVPLPKIEERELGTFPELLPLLESSGLLPDPDEGHAGPPAGGIIVEARGTAGENWLFFGLHGAHVSDDHYPYYEILASATDDPIEWRYVNGLRFNYDQTMFEGVEWFRLWRVVSVTGVFLVCLVPTLGWLIWYEFNPRARVTESLYISDSMK